MAATFVIEEESGTYRASRQHPHNGYYAGDFSNEPFRPLPMLPAWETQRALTS